MSARDLLFALKQSLAELPAEERQAFFRDVHELEDLPSTATDTARQEAIKRLDADVAKDKPAIEEKAKDLHTRIDNWLVTVQQCVNQVDASFQNINAILPHVNAGKLRALAVTGAKRSALLPNVPTLSESGVKDADVYSWQGIAAPKGLPADVKAKLHAAIVAALNDPAVRPKLLEVGFEIVANTPAQFAAFQAAESARWKHLIETRKITAD